MIKRDLFLFLCVIAVAAGIPVHAEKTRTITVPKSDVVSAYNDLFQTMELVIDNYGGKKKSQWYRQQSYMRLPTGEKITFDVPRFYLKLEVPVIKVKRYWHYFINELQVERTRVTAGAQGVKAQLLFESQGNEIKGKCTRRSLNGKDNCEYRGKRDIQLDNARMNILLRPAVVDNRLGYAPLRAADITLTADVKMPTKLCKRLRSLKWISVAMGAAPAAYGAAISQSPCEKIRAMIIEYVKQRAAERLRHSFNQPQVRRSVARMISQKVGIRLNKGEKLVGVKEQGTSLVLTVKQPDRKPADGKKKVKPKRVALGIPVSIASFEAKPKVLVGKCPGKVEFVGSITAKVPGVVQYYFENDRGVRSGVYKLKFDKPGTKMIIPWSVGVDRPKRGAVLAVKPGKRQPSESRYEVEGTQKLVVLWGKNKLVRTAEYKVDCDKPKIMKIRKLAQ